MLEHPRYLDMANPTWCRALPPTPAKNQYSLPGIFLCPHTVAAQGAGEETGMFLQIQQRQLVCVPIPFIRTDPHPNPTWGREAVGHVCVLDLSPLLDPKETGEM